MGQSPGHSDGNTSPSAGHFQEGGMFLFGRRLSFVSSRLELDAYFTTRRSALPSLKVAASGDALERERAGFFMGSGRQAAARRGRPWSGWAVLWLLAISSRFRRAAEKKSWLLRVFRWLPVT